MNIAIGTKRKAKIDGVKKGFMECVFTPDEFVCTEHDVDSGISHMPMTMAETMQGAKNRAENIKKEGVESDYYVGLEGGLVQEGDKSYLVSLAYIMNKDKEGHFGFSAMIEVPEKIHSMMFDDGMELGPIMGELSGNVDIRSENGSMGAWSNDMFLRADEFASAVKAALSPFYNEYYKL